MKKLFIAGTAGMVAGVVLAHIGPLAVVVGLAAAVITYVKVVA